METQLYDYNETGGGIAFESAISAIRSVSNEILVPQNFLPLIYVENPAATVKFKQTGAKGIVLYDTGDFGRVVIGGSSKKPNGTQVVISGEYKIYNGSKDILVDYPKIGVKDRVRSSVGYENFLFVRRMNEKDFRRGPWGYAFWLTE